MAMWFDKFYFNTVNCSEQQKNNHQQQQAALQRKIENIWKIAKRVGRNLIVFI